MDPEAENFKKRECKRKQDVVKKKIKKLDTLYMFGEIELGIIMDSNGKIWFKGADVARALEYEEPNKAVSLFVYKHHTKMYKEFTHQVDYSIHPKTIFINETGLNLFIMRSLKPKSEEFAEWVCGTVLPSIRETNKYETDSENNPYRELNEYLKNEMKEMKVACKEKDTKIFYLMDTIISLKPTAVPVLSDERKSEYIVIYKLSNELYYCSRIQDYHLDQSYNEVKKKYPEAEILIKFKTPNSVNTFNFLLEQIPFIERVTLKNHFRIKSESGRNELDLINNVKNVLRTTYGVEC